MTEIPALPPRTQIIRVTAKDASKGEAIRAGFGFLLKPFQISKLIRYIDSKFQNFEFSKQLGHPSDASLTSLIAIET
jgi:hypothetical protein